MLNASGFVINAEKSHQVVSYLFYLGIQLIIFDNKVCQIVIGQKSLFCIRGCITDSCLVSFDVTENFKTTKINFFIKDGYKQIGVRGPLKTD